MIHQHKSYHHFLPMYPTNPVNSWCILCVNPLYHPSVHPVHQFAVPEFQPGTKARRLSDLSGEYGVETRDCPNPLYTYIYIYVYCIRIYIYYYMDI